MREITLNSASEVQLVGSDVQLVGLGSWFRGPGASIALPEGIALEKSGWVYAQKKEAAVELNYPTWYAHPYTLGAVGGFLFGGLAIGGAMALYRTAKKQVKRASR